MFSFDPKLRWKILGRAAVILFALVLAPLAWCGDEVVSTAAEEHAEEDTLSRLPYVISEPGEFPRTWQLTPGSTFRLRGRIDVDSLWPLQSAANIATFGDFDDDVGLRRARIGGEGTLGDFGRYVAEIDLASGLVVPRDVYIGIGDATSAGEFRSGHFREPFSLEGATSANSFAFLERSTINILDPARNWGFGVFRADLENATTLAFGAFHAGVDAGDFQGGPGSTVGFTGRWTITPINEGEGEQLAHFGVALSGRIPESGLIIVNQRPLNPLLNRGDSSISPFSRQIPVPARFEQLINLQCALVDGPIWVQSEWYGALIDQTSGGDVCFHGAYLAAGYFVTGEHRKYLAESGALDGVHVERPFLLGPGTRDRERGMGAWELTTRLDYIDLFDPDSPRGPSGQLLGVTMPGATLGANWYLTDRLRVLFNYTYVAPNEPNSGVSFANVFGVRINAHW